MLEPGAPVEPLVDVPPAPTVLPAGFVPFFEALPVLAFVFEPEVPAIPNAELVPLEPTPATPLELPPLLPPADPPPVPPPDRASARVELSASAVANAMVVIFISFSSCIESIESLQRRRLPCLEPKATERRQAPPLRSH